MSLNELAVDTEEFKSAASSIYTFIVPSEVTNYVIPPALDESLYTLSGWVFEKQNDVIMTFTYTPSGSEHALTLNLGSDHASMNENRYQINLCGTTTIQSVVNSQASQVQSGSSVDCSSTQNFKIVVTSSSVSVYQSETYLVGCTRTMDIQAFTFGYNGASSTSLWSNDSISNIKTRISRFSYYDPMDEQGNWIDDNNRSLW